MPTHTNADVSHRNSIAYKFKEFIDSLKQNGVRLTTKKIFRRFYYYVIGVDFSLQNLHDLNIVGDHAKNATALVSTSKDFLFELFEILQSEAGEEFKKGRFIDIGSGKGAAIIFAKEFGFKRSLGVEFAKELHKIAQKNIKKLDINEVVSINKDAVEYFPPRDTTVIFLFNPFDRTVMRKVVKNILKARESFIYSCYLIYVNPTASKELDEVFEIIMKKEFKNGAKVLFYKL